MIGAVRVAGSVLAVFLFLGAVALQSTDRASAFNIFGTGPAPTPTPTPTNYILPSGGAHAQGPLKVPSFKKLGLNQRVLDENCKASPMTCLCPLGATKVQFMEAEATVGGAVMPKTMCITATCPAGQYIRQSNSTGTRNFACSPAPVMHASAKSKVTEREGTR